MTGAFGLVGVNEGKRLGRFGAMEFDDELMPPDLAALLGGTAAATGDATWMTVLSPVLMLTLKAGVGMATGGGAFTGRGSGARLYGTAGGGSLNNGGGLKAGAVLVLEFAKAANCAGDGGGFGIGL